MTVAVDILSPDWTFDPVSQNTPSTVGHRVQVREVTPSDSDLTFEQWGIVAVIDNAFARIVETLERKLDPLPEWTNLPKSPSARVRQLAIDLHVYLSEGCLKPNRVVPSADGEIAYYFFVKDDADGSPLRFASITCAEGGELVLLMVDKEQGITDAVEFSIESSSVEDTIKKLAEFIGPCPDQ